jgi:hypothetical protein
LTTSLVLFTALRCGLDACKVDLDLYTSGLMPLSCATAHVAVTIQVVMDIHVECYDLLKVGILPLQCRDLGHSIDVSGALLTVLGGD